MDLLFSIFEIAVNALEYVMMLLFFRHKLGFKNERKLLPLLICFVLFIVSVGVNKLALPEPVGMLIFAVLELLYAIFFFGKSLTMRIFSGLAPTVIFVASNYIVISLLGIIMPITPDAMELLNPTLYRFEAQILYLIVVAALFLTVSVVKIKTDNGYMGMVQNIALIILVTLCVFTMSVLINVSVYVSSIGEEQTAILCSAAAGVLLAASIGIYILFRSMSIINKRFAEEERRLQKMELEREHYEDIYEAYEQLRIWQHESTGRIEIVEALAKSSNSDEVLRFLSKSYDDINNAETIVTTGHPVVDAMISNELAKAKKNGISVSPIIIMPYDLPIDDIDLCSVVTNLFENAIECVKKLDKRRRYIDFEMNIRSKSMVISITNPSDGVYNHDSDNRLLTTKANTKSHGLGLKIVTSIVERANGIIEVMPYNDKFSVTVLIPLKEVVAS